MYFRIKKSGPRKYVQICETRWENGKTVQHTLTTLGRAESVLESGDLDALLISGSKLTETLAIISAHKNADPASSHRQIIGPVMVFERLWEETGIKQILGSLLKERKYKFDVERAIFITVLHRLMESGSDLACEEWRKSYRMEGADNIQLHHLYRAMDFLGSPIAEGAALNPLSERYMSHAIEELMFLRRRDLFTGLQVVFFDTTSLYFEGRGGEEWGENGFSKDHRSDLKQMIVGIVIDETGNPICSEMWEGSTTDVTVFLPVIERLRIRFGIGSMCVVADRGMISKETIKEFEAQGIHYILGARMRNDTEVRDEVLSHPGRYEEVRPERQNTKDPAPLEVKNVKLDGRRYIICRNKEEAEAEVQIREVIIEKLKEALSKGDKQLVKNKGYRRFLKSHGRSFEIDQTKIEEDARYDGKYVLRTDMTESAPIIALQYKHLYTIEAVMRKIKSVFETRPIYHKYASTIRGHVFCSFLALRLMNDLKKKMEGNGTEFKWETIKRDLNELYEDELSVGKKRCIVRSDFSKVAAQVIRSLGMQFSKKITFISQCDTNA
jgi:transposase